MQIWKTEESLDFETLFNFRNNFVNSSLLERVFSIFKFSILVFNFRFSFSILSFLFQILGSSWFRV